MEILRRFDMLDCEAMATPMGTNMKLLFDETSELVDMTQYRHIIGSLMYMTKKARYMFCYEHLESVSS